MNAGQYISGAGHIGLIGWALLGGVFTAEPLPFEVTEVTAISSEDFAALVAPQDSPDAVSDIVTPQAPDAQEDTPEIAATPDEAPAQVEPDVTEPAEADETPDVTELTPLPETDVSDEPPVLEPPSEDVAVLLPDNAVRPKPRPAERVAPEPVAQPEPDVRVDDVAQPEITPDETAEVPREETDETAPEEATTEIVTEAEKAAAAALDVQTPTDTAQTDRARCRTIRRANRSRTKQHGCGCERGAGRIGRGRRYHANSVGWSGRES